MELNVYIAESTHSPELVDANVVGYYALVAIHHGNNFMTRGLLRPNKGPKGSYILAVWDMVILTGDLEPALCLHP